MSKGSFLFVDEPESNLHPAWQIVMAKSLFELSRQGINVIISTHSTTILKWLEVHIKKHPEDAPLVSLNKFSAEGAEILDSGDFSYDISAIKKELTKPFADLYIEGL